MSRATTRKLGYTLLEMMVVISVTGILMTLSIGWLNETMKFSSRIESHRQQHLQLSRLSLALRNDVRSCESMVVEDNKHLRLVQSDGWVTTYTISGHQIEVKKQNGSQQRQERYPLPPTSVIHWDDEQLPTTIGLIVKRNPHPTLKHRENVASKGDSASGDGSTPIDIHIYASINRWDGQVTPVSKREWNP